MTRHAPQADVDAAIQRGRESIARMEADGDRPKTATHFDLTQAVPGLEFSAEFVPWKQSRNAGEKSPSLNWIVRFKRGRRVLQTDYMQGIGHLDGYKQGRKTIHNDDAEKAAANSGKWNGYDRIGTKPIPAPLDQDVMQSLLLDAEALDCETFEEWAEDNGSDPDSRKAEAVYKACLQIGLTLRLLVGDEGMAALREMLKDL